MIGFGVIHAAKGAGHQQQKQRKRDQPVQKYSAKTDAKISSRERNALRSVDPCMQSVDNDLLSKAIIMRSLLSSTPVQIAPIIPDGIIALPTQFVVYFNLTSAISFPQSENRKPWTLTLTLTQPQSY